MIETVVRNLQLCNLISDEVLVEKDILLGTCTENSNYSIVNAIILYFKWAIWKIRNKCKFDKIKLNVQSIQALLKLHMKNELKFLLLRSDIKYICKTKIKLFIEKF